MQLLQTAKKVTCPFLVTEKRKLNQIDITKLYKQGKDSNNLLCGRYDLYLSEYWNSRQNQFLLDITSKYEISKFNNIDGIGIILRRL